MPRTRWMLPGVLLVFAGVIAGLAIRRSTPQGDRAGRQTGPRPTEPSPQTSADRPSVGPAPHPLSLGAYRGEVRYLHTVYRKIDLSGPPVKTDGWRRNIPEAEWPFMGMCYFGMACSRLAEVDPAFREEALGEARFVVQALQTPRMTGFITEHYGPPFAKTSLRASVFVHGLFLNAAVRYREASGDDRFDPVIHRVAAALAGAFERDEQGILQSYPRMWWLGDNFTAMGALGRYDRVFDRDASRAKAKLLASVRRHYTDKKTGLFCTYVNPNHRRARQGPRGISVMYALHFLKDFAPEFAADQYARARRHLIRTGIGVGAVREYPEGQTFRGDVDSGPVLFGLGLSASGFGIAAAAINGDREAAMSLLRASALAGAPQYEGGKVRYATMPAVGQAVVLFGKAVLLDQP